MSIPRIAKPRAAAQPRTRRRGSPAKQDDVFWAAIMIGPMFLGLLVFYIWPAFQTFYFSFTDWGAFGKYKWAGSTNYERLLQDADVWQALRNTFIYTALSVPASILFAILVAVLLNQKIRGVSIYRTLYFLPAITMPAAMAMVWRWLFNGDYGLINYGLAQVGISGPRWLSDPNLVLYSLIIVGIWASLGSNMVLFLSGLQGIPQTYYEAASIDGAGPVRKFFRITLPLLTPTIFFATLISLVTAFQVFDLVYLMIGPDSPVIKNTQTVVYLFFEHAFLTNNKGYAATITVLLFAIIMVVTAIQFRLQRRWVHYG